MIARRLIGSQVARGRVHDCILAPVPLEAVCVTSVDRCSPSSGVSVGCAFSPDGGVFIGGPTISDNNVLTATGWRFAQAPSSGLPDEWATVEEGEECYAAQCFPFCPGVPVVDLYCYPDSGTPDAGQTDGGVDGG